MSYNKSNTSGDSFCVSVDDSKYNDNRPTSPTTTMTTSTTPPPYFFSASITGHRHPTHPVRLELVSLNESRIKLQDSSFTEYVSHATQPTSLTNGHETGASISWRVCVQIHPQATDITIYIHGHGNTENNPPLAHGTATTNKLFQQIGTIEIHTDKDFAIALTPISSSLVTPVLNEHAGIQHITRCFQLFYHGEKAPNSNNNNGDLIVRETIAEPRHGFESSISFLDQRLITMNEQLKLLTSLLKRVRASHGLFSSALEAKTWGYSTFKLRILSANNLPQTHRETSGNQSSLTSPFVVIQVRDSITRQERLIGRTNTEYRTADPIFGSNTNVRLAEHAYPQTRLLAGRYGRVVDNGKSFELYCKPTDQVIFTIYHERFQVQKGLSQLVIASGEVSMNGTTALTSTRKLTSTTINNEDGGGIKLSIDLLPNKTKSKLQVVVEKVMDSIGSGNPFDGLMSNDDEVGLNKIPPYWLAKHVQHVSHDVEKLQSMQDFAKTAALQRVTFKSSAAKGELKSGSLATNLHISEFMVYDATQGKSRIRATVSCGIPTAHVLGLTSREQGLSSLESRRLELLMNYLQTKVGEFTISQISGEVSFAREMGMELVEANQLDMDDTVSVDASIAVGGGEELRRPRRVSVGALGRSAIAAVASKFSGSQQQQQQQQQKSQKLPLQQQQQQPSTSTQSDFTREQSLDDSSSIELDSTVNTSNSNNAIGGSEPLSPPTNLTTWQLLLSTSHDYFMRSSVVMAQVFPILSSLFISEARLACARQHIEWGKTCIQYGFLFSWESLVSTHGREFVMLMDLIGAIRYLNDYVTLKIHVADTDSVVVIPPIGFDKNTMVQLHIGLCEEDFLFLFGGGEGSATDEGVSIKLVALLFQCGINEEQSIAALSDREACAQQKRINKSSAELLIQYSNAIGRPISSFGKLNRLIQVIDNQREDYKETEVLLLSDDVIRELNGGRIVSCKSGKDRTGMSCTLENALFVFPTENNIAITSANLFREYGVRLQIAVKNIGIPFYSFNSIQRMSLPVAYQPPGSVILSMVSSIRGKDKS